MYNSKLPVAFGAGSLLGLAALAVSVAAFGDPVDEELLIDGEPMQSRTAAREGSPFTEVISGWHYRTDDTRALETDSFDNPGMLGVEEGEELWNTVDGSEGKSCASCHDDASVSMSSVGATFPKWDPVAQRPINVELQINQCRTERMGAEAYPFDKAGQKPLTAYVKHQALGKPLNVDLADGDMQKWADRGKELYYTRMGQLDLSCANCHEQNNGNYIRADHLSQGQVNGFPTYRLKQSALVSLHNRYRGCIRDTRAEFPDAFSDDLMALELYTTARGTGLSVETPAVRQ